MADENPTTTSSDATAADFDPEDLATGPKTVATETEKPEEGDEEFDFDPATEEFEIPTPKTEEKVDEDRAGPIAEKVEPKEEKEEKKQGGGEEKKTSQEKDKSGRIPSDKISSDEDKTPIPPSTSSSEKSPIVKVKIGEKDYDIPEDTYQAVKDTIETASNLRARTEELARGLIEKPTDTLLDLYTRYFKGDKEKARDHLIKEYAEVIDKELQRQSLPKEQRELLEAQEKLQSLEEENKRFREQEEHRKRETERREALDGFMGEVVRTMKELGMDTKPENEDAKQFAFKVVDELMALRESGKPALPIEVVKKFKTSLDRQLSENAKKYEASLDDIPDEDLFRRHQKLVDRLRKLDIAKHKAEQTQTKTPPKPTNGAERETSRSKKRSLNSTEWDKTWR